MQQVAERKATETCRENLRDPPLIDYSPEAIPPMLPAGGQTFFQSELFQLRAVLALRTYQTAFDGMIAELGYSSVSDSFDSFVDNLQRHDKPLARFDHVTEPIRYGQIELRGGEYLVDQAFQLLRFYLNQQRRLLRTPKFDLVAPHPK